MSKKLAGLNRSPREQSAENIRMAIRALTILPVSGLSTKAIKVAGAALNTVANSSSASRNTSLVAINDSIAAIVKLKVIKSDLIPHPAILAEAEFRNALMYLE